MSKRRTHRLSSPLLPMQLAMASWEVIARRSLMMAGQACSPAEYQRMVLEKMQAAQESGLVLLRSGGQADLARVLAPWHRRARANVRRLRRK